MIKTPRPNLYDYLKIIAIVLMIIDHLWFFFFPDALWMRLLGRGAFPIFLTLVWLSGSYRRRRDLVIGAIIVQIPIIIYSLTHHTYSFLTLNILWSIIIARAIIYLLQKNKDIKRYIAVSCLLLPFLPITEIVFDYGAFAIYFALRWAMLQEKRDILTTSMYGAIVWALLMIFSIANFGFDYAQQEIIRVYAIIHMILMYIVQYKNYSIHIHKKRDTIVYKIAKNALLIYIIHICAFVIIKSILWHISA